MAKAAALPLPVSAATITSPPPRMSGIERIGRAIGMIETVFANLAAAQRKTRYTVDINDNVTFTSLAASTWQCLFKMIGDYTPLLYHGYFARARRVRVPDHVGHYVAVRNSSDRSINSPWMMLEELTERFPARTRRQMAENQVQMYNINVGHIAREVVLKGGTPLKRMFGKKGEVSDGGAHVWQRLCVSSIECCYNCDWQLQPAPVMIVSEKAESARVFSVQRSVHTVGGRRAAGGVFRGHDAPRAARRPTSRCGWPPSARSATTARCCAHTQ